MAAGDMTLWYILSSPNRENYFSFNDQFRQGWAIYIAFLVWPALCITHTRKAMFKNVKIFGWLMFVLAIVFFGLVKSEAFWSVGDMNIPVLSQIVLKLASIQFP